MNGTARIAVLGIGVVGGFGCGIADFARALAGGEVSPGSVAVAAADGPAAVPAFRADTSRLTDFVPARTLRRIDHFARMGLLGAHLALADAGLPAADRGPLGLIVATGFGATGITFAFLDSFFKDGDLCASPTHFANSVHNAAAANISILLGAAGPGLTVSQFYQSVPAALATARLWLLEGRVDRVLFGAVDELSELVAYIRYRQAGALPPAGMAPLGTARETAVPGEGAAFFLLSRVASDGDGYCTLDAAATGRGNGPDREALVAPLLVLCADGRREPGARYAEAAAGARVACYSPLYGSTPAGPAFDVAAAALILKEGHVFPSPRGEARDFPATVAAGGEPLGGARVACLGLSDGEWGLVALGRAGGPEKP